VLCECVAIAFGGAVGGLGAQIHVQVARFLWVCVRIRPGVVGQVCWFESCLCVCLQRLSGVCLCVCLGRCVCARSCVCLIVECNTADTAASSKWSLEIRVCVRKQIPSDRVIHRLAQLRLLLCVSVGTYKGMCVRVMQLWVRVYVALCVCVSVESVLGCGTDRYRRHTHIHVTLAQHR
jgi:hypothetical protein